MARKKKTNETENSQRSNVAETESALQSSDSGGTETPENVSGENSEVEKEVTEILSGFSDEPEEIEFEPATSSSEISEDKPRQRRKNKKKETAEKATLKVPGKLFIAICDRVVVGVITTADSYLSKNPVPEEYLHLTKEQLNDEELIALAEAAIKEMKLEDKPIPVFFGTLAGLYITNYITVKSLIAQQIKAERAKQNEVYMQPQTPNDTQ